MSRFLPQNIYSRVSFFQGLSSTHAPYDRRGGCLHGQFIDDIWRVEWGQLGDYFLVVHDCVSFGLWNRKSPMTWVAKGLERGIEDGLVAVILSQHVIETLTRFEDIKG